MSLRYDTWPPLTFSLSSVLTADSSAVLCSQPKRGRVRRQARIEQHAQEQLHDPWIRLPDNCLEKLPEIHHQHHHRHAAVTTQIVNIHSKPSTMSDENNSEELNGTATDVTSDPLSDIAPDNTSESSPGSKKAPPVAPKPAWFRQSLRKIRDEQDQKKPGKPAEQRTAVGFNRNFGARAASPAASMSIKQKIHSFETFSSPEGPEKVGNRRPVTPSTSLPVMEKESKSHPASHETPKEIPSSQSALIRETDYTVSASPSAITSSTSEAYSEIKAEPSEDEPPSIQSPTDLPPSETISTDLDSGINDFQSTPAHEDENVLPSKQESDTENVDLSRSTESRDLSPATSVGCNQDDRESPSDGAEGYGAKSQEKLLSMTVSAATPTDSSSLRGLEGESIGKILAFSNQVIWHTWGTMVLYFVIFWDIVEAK